LAEEEWIDTLYPYYKEICEYIPFIDFAGVMVKKLREEEKCDMVIALTHMMKYNDIKLAKNIKGIDLVLGGHDHLIVHEKVNDSVLVKSGTDFRNFSIIKVHKKGEIPVESKQDTVFLENSKWVFEI
jgi:5'-nucleotidase